MEIGFANPDGTQDTYNLRHGETKLQFRNLDGSVDRWRLRSGETGIGTANPDGSYDTLWIGRDKKKGGE